MPKIKTRDDFPQKTKEMLAKRVNFICSNPECRRGTTAAATESDKHVNTGVAAHICAASPGGPRYNSNMSSEERSNIENGIWLCQTCATLIDRDVKAYTVEKLHQWKDITEGKAKDGLVYPMYEITELDRKIMEFVPNESSVIEWESDKTEDSYSDFYKEYIRRFDSLKDYLFCKIFGNFFNKDFDDFDDDQTLTFGKNILDWLIGETKFPECDLNKFYNFLSKDYNFDNNSIIKKRWEAIISYFNNDIENAQKIYFELYDSVKSNNNIPFWFKDDIYIDGRNINNLLDNISGKFSVNNIFQQQIDKNKHKLSYPGLDRIRCDIYEKAIERVIDYKNKSEYTRIYGIGLENFLNLIQESVYISIIYGSITQLRLVRNVFSNVMALYSDCYKEEKFYQLTLKLKILSGGFRDYKNIYNKIRYDYKFLNKSDFIDSLYNLKDSLLFFDIDSFYCFFFEVYGRNIPDEKFSFLEKKILEMLDDKKEINPNYICNALKAIPNNINRFKNKYLLFKILLNYVKKGYSRFYIEFGSILNNVKFQDLNNKEKKIFVGLIKNCYKLENIDAINAIIEIKNYTKTKDFDDYLQEKNTPKSIINKLNARDDLGALKEMINNILFRVNKREEDPGVHIEYAIDYNIISFFTKRSYSDEIKQIAMNDVIPLAKKILLSKNQYAKEKINMLKVISEILNVEHLNKEINEQCKFILDNIILESPAEHFSVSKNPKDIMINLEMTKFFVKTIKLSDLLNQYLMYSVEDDNNLEEILKCILLVSKNTKISRTNMKKVYVIYNLAINKRKINLTRQAIELLSLFINTEFLKIIISDLEEIISYNNYDELISIIDMIYKLNKSKREKLNQILSLLRCNNNYNIKYVIKKYLNYGG